MIFIDHSENSRNGKSVGNFEKEGWWVVSGETIASGFGFAFKSLGQTYDDFLE